MFHLAIIRTSGHILDVVYMGVTKSIERVTYLHLPTNQHAWRKLLTLSSEVIKLFGADMKLS